jgi:hypothetical protein
MQIIYTSGQQFHIDDDVDEDVIEKLRAFVAANPNNK